MARTKASPKSSAALGFEANLWLTADKLRNNMDAAEYKHVVFGLIFLKYIAGNREEHRAKLMKGEGDYAGAKQTTIGKIVDDAMVADNPRLKGVLPEDCARLGLDQQRLGELIDVIATIELTAASEGEKTHRSVDLLDRVYDLACS